MGMGTTIMGFVPPDAEYAKKVAAWKACEAAGVEAPRELMLLFDGNEPQDCGMEVDIKAAVTECRPFDGAEGFDVDITKLPKGVHVIRFYNAW